MSGNPEVIHTQIWKEIPEPDNPFAASVCLCAGYDVYGDLLGKASWIEYLYLLFKQERPTPDQARLLEGLAIALANPGPRDPAVHAAMSGGTGGSTQASCLMAALAVGAGQLGGAHEVALVMEYWQTCGRDLDLWRNLLKNPPKEERIDVWLPVEHPPGFDPHGASCTTPVRQTLAFLAQCSPGESLRWLQCFRPELESIADSPLAMTGVAAAALVDLGFTPEQGEMLFLLLRLPGAAVHALEQQHYGWRRFPFFAHGLKLENDPCPESTQTK
jgi:citrate synthase